MGMDIRKRFGQRVRELRTAKNLSQEELAFRAGIHRTYLGGIERGERNPALENIDSIAKALGITLIELFAFGNKRQPVGRKRSPALPSGSS